MENRHFNENSTIEKKGIRLLIVAVFWAYSECVVWSGSLCDSTANVGCVIYLLLQTREVTHWVQTATSHRMQKTALSERTEDVPG